MMINDESYILTNFEYALESKNIKPFFQPIVRNITGGVCSRNAQVGRSYQRASAE